MEKASTDVFEESSSDLICCRSCEWYTSRKTMLDRGYKLMKRYRDKLDEYPDPAFYCESYDRCKTAILTGARNLAKKLLDLKVINDISEGPSYVAAIIGEWD